jgi:hypothetical protein
MRNATILAVALLAGLGAAAAVAQRSSPATVDALPTVEVFKSPTCGCCSKWVDHLRANDFAVRATDTDQVDAIKSKHGVPMALRSCHTALVGGYVLEGHVPAADVARLLKERPQIVGLAVGGMPVGSPGMEVPGRPADPYDVVAFDQAGRTTVFREYR